MEDKKIEDKVICIVNPSRDSNIYPCVFNIIKSHWESIGEVLRTHPKLSDTNIVEYNLLRIYNKCVILDDADSLPDIIYEVFGDTYLLTLFLRSISEKIKYEGENYN